MEFVIEETPEEEEALIPNYRPSLGNFSAIAAAAEWRKRDRSAYILFSFRCRELDVSSLTNGPTIKEWRWWLESCYWRRRRLLCLWKRHRMKVNCSTVWDALEAVAISVCENSNRAKVSRLLSCGGGQTVLYCWNGDDISVSYCW